MMFKSNHKGRYLALSLALALGGTFGGAVFGSVTEAADVTINVLPPPDENKGSTDKMKAVRLVQNFCPAKETNRTHSKGYAEDSLTMAGRKGCTKMTG